MDRIFNDLSTFNQTKNRLSDSHDSVSPELKGAAYLSHLFRNFLLPFSSSFLFAFIIRFSITFFFTQLRYTNISLSFSLLFFFWKYLLIFSFNLRLFCLSAFVNTILNIIVYSKSFELCDNTTNLAFTIVKTLIWQTWRILNRNSCVER